MSKSPTPPAADAADPADKAMTKAQAGKLVRRPVEIKGPDGKPVKGPDGKPVVKSQPIPEEDVLDFRDYGSHVVVVTTDGQKFSSAPAA